MNEFNPAAEREKQSRAVLQAAIDYGLAAELLDALTSGGGYVMNRFTGSLEIRTKRYFQDQPRDAISIVLTEHAAKTITVDAGFRDEVLAQLDVLLYGGAFGALIEGVQIDEIDDTMTHGPVVILLRTHWDEAERERKRLAAQLGIEGDVNER